jgi:MOSC domain-containing protein YiiM
VPGTVAAIFVAPEAEATPLQINEVLTVLERGLEGDRYFFGRGSFSRWPGEGRDLTLFETEAIDAILREHGIDLSEGRSRRNVETVGIDLNDLNGRRFRIGEAVLRGARLCAPCRHLERLVGPGTYDAMLGRGGLRANILEGGVIRVGDVIEPL